VAFALKSMSWDTAWIPASAGMTKSLAIFRRFSHQRTLFHHPLKLRFGCCTSSKTQTIDFNHKSSRLQTQHFIFGSDFKCRPVFVSSGVSGPKPG
jgi:hypothetical protein